MTVDYYFNLTTGGSVGWAIVECFGYRFVYASGPVSTTPTKAPFSDSICWMFQGNKLSRFCKAA